MVLILTFDFVVKHILKAPGYLCICCHGLRPMLCLKKTFPVWEELTSPMLASSCVTSVRDNMRSWGGLPQILTSHHPLVLHSQPERPRDDCAGITQLMCFSLLSSFRSTFQAVKVSFYPNLSGVRSRIFLYCSQMLWTIKWILEFFIGFTKFLLLSNDMLTLITSRFCQMIHPIFLPPEEQTANHLLTGYIQRNIDQLNHKIIMEN